MLDNILGTLRRGVDRARARGEEVTQAARLRFEIYQLHRESDALYGRLGRAYHSGAELGVLQPIRDEIARVDEEIAARERLIAELNASTDAEQAPVSPLVVTAAPAEAAGGAFTADTTPDATPAPGENRVALEKERSLVVSQEAAEPPRENAVGTLPTAVSVYQAKRLEEGGPSMDEDRFVTDADGLTPAQKDNPLITRSDERDPGKNEPNEDYQQRVDEGQRVSRGNLTDAQLHGSNAPIPPMGTLAGNAQGIRRAPVDPNVDGEAFHDRTLAEQEHDEARKAARDPDPLDK